jgi:hypothetical protein
VTSNLREQRIYEMESPQISRALRRRGCVHDDIDQNSAVPLGNTAAMEVT